MPLIGLTLPWVNQPTGQVGISPALGPVTEVWVGSKFGQTLLQQTTTTANNVTTVDGAAGKAVSLVAGASSALTIANNADLLFPSNSTATIAIYRFVRDTTARSSALFGYNNPGADRVLAHAPFSDGNIYWDFGDSFGGRLSTSFPKAVGPEALVLVAGPNRGREIWRNGVRIASGASSTTRSSNSSPFTLGAVTSSDADADDIALFVISPYEWDPRLIQEWSWKPYATTFAPQRIWVPVTAGGAATHTATGALAAGSATIAGTASRIGNHSASGALAAGSAVVAGTANRFAVHTSSGALVGGAATIAGVASRTRVHTAVAALIADAATIAGSAARAASGTHLGSGSLVAGSATVAGSASRVGNHAATGALVAQSATISGTANHLLLHTSSGAFVASSATVAGSAARTGPAVTHTATGALVAGSAQISGGNSTAAGGSYEGSKPRKKKFFIEKDGKLLVFNTANAAVNALPDLPETATPKQVKKVQAQVIEALKDEKPVEEIAVRQVKQLADPRIDAMLQQRNYQALVDLYNRIMIERDEEDIEELLLAL